MLTRRLLVKGSLSLAIPAVAIPARAQASRISVAFVGHEL